MARRSRRAVAECCPMWNRSLTILLFLACGCHSFQLMEGDAPTAGESDAGPTVLAAALWSRGQDAMRTGQIDRAIAFYEESLHVDPTCTHNHLSLAAARLEKGEPEEACVQLAHYVEAHPEHV